MINRLWSSFVKLVYSPFSQIPLNMTVQQFYIGLGENGLVFISLKLSSCQYQLGKILRKTKPVFNVLLPVLLLLFLLWFWRFYLAQYVGCRIIVCGSVQYLALVARVQRVILNVAGAHNVLLGVLGHEGRARRVVTALLDMKKKKSIVFNVGLLEFNRCFRHYENEDICRYVNKYMQHVRHGDANPCCRCDGKE